MVAKRRSSKPKSNSEESGAPPPEKKKSDRKSFPMVGIGASAGGLETFTQLLKALPADTGMAFVLIQHLDPKHASILAELLARATAMPVIEVKNGIRAEPDHVYVIPPNVDMAVLQGRLHLLPRSTEARKPPMPIDYFFRSLAQDQGNKAIGVVLSGTASDGSLGLKLVKAEGGITFAQDPATAKYDGMPRAAIAAGGVDFVLSPEELAKELAWIGRHPYVVRQKEGEVVPEGEEDLISRVFILLRGAVGVDFTYYKHATIKRRITRRMVLYRLEKLDDYVKYLYDHPEEVQALYDDILITVTAFWRDSEAFDAVRNEIFPKIVQDKGPDNPIRIWVAGCATGEEAYTVAMSLLEFLDGQPISPPIQLFATDIHEKAIEKARRGVYPESVVEGVSPARLRRFFVPVEGGYQVNRLIRDMCVFARHDVTKDPPFSRLDFITCRNVLIYLGSVLQKKVLPMFHWALNPTGFLLLGASETVGQLTDLFDLVDRKHKIYAGKAVPTRLPVDFAPLGESGPKPRLPAVPAVPMVPLRRAGETKEFDLGKDADRLVLERFAPAGVIVDENLEILQFRGETGPYLRPAPGKASLNLLDMARQGLKLDLRAAVFAARKTGAPVTKERLSIEYDGRSRDVNIEVLPIKAPTGVTYYLVLFEEFAQSPEADKPAPAKGGPAKSVLKSERDAERFRDELAETKEYARAIIEERDATNEELRAANEELQSTTEELQSINEELETAKEELQSSNEELTTVNEEMQNRNNELIQTTDDMTNLLSSVNMPFVMLSNDLRIRRITPVAEKTLNVAPTDIGRPITAVKLKFDIPDLEQLVLNVIDTMTLAEREIRDPDGRWYSLRVRPYKTIENKIDGAVMTFVDIDELKRTQHDIEEARDYAEAVVRTIRESLVVLDENLRVVSANRTFYDTFHGAPAETENKLIYEVGGRQWDIPGLKKLLEEILPGRTEFADFEVEHDFQTIGRRTMLLNARKIIQPGKGRQLILLAIEDVTERQRADLALRQEKDKAQMYLNIAGVMLVAVDADQNVIMINKKGCDVLGYKEDRIIGKNWFDNFLPARVRDEVKAVASSLIAGQVEPAEYFENPILTRSGEERLIAWHNAVLRNVQGEIVAHLSSGEDITDRKRTEDALKSSEERFRAIAATATDAVISIDSAGKIVLWNRAAAKHFGFTAKEAIGRNIEIILPERHREPHKRGLARFLVTGETHIIGKTVTIEGLRKDGSEFPVELSIAAWKTGEGTFFTGIIRDITQRRRVEAEQRQAKELGDALNDINAAIGSTFNADDIMKKVTLAAGKVLGTESAGVLLRKDDDWSVRYAFGLKRDETIGMLVANKDAPHLALAIRSNKAVVINDVSKIEQAGRKTLDRFGVRSALIVPLVLREEAIGAIVFRCHSSARPFSESQVDFANKLGASLSLALENSRLYAEEHNIAETLQEALLTVPEQIEGLEFGHLYESATVETARVGGDFYDIFELTPDKVGIIIGDVSGKGLRAATVTAQIRNTIKAYAYQEESPGVVMTKTNEAFNKNSDKSAFVTVFFGMLDKRSGALVFANAGHPPPIIKRKTSTTSLVVTGLPPVGVVDGHYYVDHTEALEKGDVLVTYTDGVTEARHGKGLYGDDRLMKLVEGLNQPLVGDIPQAIFKDVIAYSGGQLADDVAILAVALG